MGRTCQPNPLFLMDYQGKREFAPIILVGFIVPPAGPGPESRVQGLRRGPPNADRRPANPLDIPATLPWKCYFRSACVKEMKSLTPSSRYDILSSRASQPSAW